MNVKNHQNKNNEQFIDHTVMLLEARLVHSPMFDNLPVNVSSTFRAFARIHQVEMYVYLQTLER